MNRFGGRATYANVTSTIALVIALGGGAAYAAGQITSSDIKDGAVKNVDLGNGSVTSSKVRDGSLKRKDLSTAARSVAAFATVVGSEDPAFVGKHRNFTAVSHQTTGVYCLTPATGIGVSNASAVVGPEWHLSGRNDLFVSALSTVDTCPVGTLEVHTYVLAAAGTVAASDAVSFSVVLP